MAWNQLWYGLLFLYPFSVASRKWPISTPLNGIPWLCGPRKYIAAAWFRALSNSNGFKFHESSKSRDNPALSTISRCDFKMGSSASSLMASSSQAMSVEPCLRLNMLINATSSASRPALSSGSSPGREEASLITASFRTTRSRRMVSFLKAAAISKFCSSSSDSSERVSSFLMAVAMSVTDLKIMEAVWWTCRSKFSRGLRTIVETDLDKTREKPTINTMTTTKSKTFIKASIQFGPAKLKEQIKFAVSNLSLFAARSGSVHSAGHGNHCSASLDKLWSGLASTLYGK
mmetsp:Transcript_137058/g.356053  ORF Transcript_137058/g.356053 Transcript_137058/m.356053 type:complete len:288 (-) Transcript_137058:333-1196(-)